MKKLYLAMITIIVASVAGQSAANPPQPSILTNNWNTAGCGLTDTARFILNNPALLEKFKTWYNTIKGGDSLPFQLVGVQGVIASGTFVKGACQGQWCEGLISTKGIALAAGEYEIKAGAAAICANTASRGNGFIEVGGTIVGNERIKQPPQPCVPDPANCTNPFGEGCCVTLGGSVSTKPR